MGVQREPWFRNMEQYLAPKMGRYKIQEWTQVEWLQASAEGVVWWARGQSRRAVKTGIVGLTILISRKRGRDCLDGENAVGKGWQWVSVGGLVAETRLVWQQQTGLQWPWQGAVSRKPVLVQLGKV